MGNSGKQINALCNIYQNHFTCVVFTNTGAQLVIALAL